MQDVESNNKNSKRNNINNITRLKQKNWTILKKKDELKKEEK